MAERLLPWLLLGLAACDGAASRSLVVDVTTDYLPGEDFTGVTTRYLLPDARVGDIESRTQAVPAVTSDDFLSGERVAEFRDVPRGTFFVEVQLQNTDGVRVAGRSVRVADAGGDRAVRVVIASGCDAVMCPDGAGTPLDSECFGGACVAPECGADDRRRCPDGLCETDEDCPAPRCGVARCEVGACLVEPGACPGGRCHPVVGCIEGGVPDAGPPCADAEASCADGVDDDCDDLIDCDDPDCLGLPCDDGVWCNGTETCGEGACEPAAARCPMGCDEDAMTCAACAADADCGAPGDVVWDGPCRYDGVCDEAAPDRRGTVTTPRCAAGVCVSEEREVVEACSRDTAGAQCGDTTYGAFGACGGYDSTCDEIGRRTRSVTRRRCLAGGCATEYGSDAEPCGRDTDGDACTYLGRCHSRCAAGTCPPQDCATATPGCPC